ncbi:MAG: glycosyltransferase [Ardenticatenaceae bacterium]|nr:glycosyltransferase [Ardenticatenaceae bacterium]
MSLVIKRLRGRPAAARNSGLRAANGTTVRCTDADCIPAPDWLRELTAPFADPDLIAAKGSYATHQPQLVARFVQLEYEDNTTSPARSGRPPLTLLTPTCCFIAATCCWQRRL